MEKTVFHIKEKSGVVIIRVTEKKLYQDVVTPFQNTMVSVLERGRKNIIVDLSEVDVMNSSGLGVLILVWDRLSRENGKLVITGLRRLMKELFQRMRLDLVFTLAENEEEALAFIRGDKKIPAK